MTSGATLTRIDAPKVSVCMITYQHAPFVAQAIESILAQKTDFDFELVIGEDCGRDDTLAICRSYAARDARVRLLPSERNLGVMANFLRTLQACRGTYIAVCEGDDYWTEAHKLQRQADFLDHSPAHGGTAHQSTVTCPGQPDRPFRNGVPRDVGVGHLLAGRLFHTASVMFKREVVDTFGRSPPVLSCDRLLNFCMAIHGPIRYMDETMCVYRLHGAGMSSNATVAQLKQDLDCVSYLKAIHPEFPVRRYLSYVYATIGLSKKATPAQRLRYLALSLLYSFAYFPRNVGFMFSRAFRLIWSRLRAARESPNARPTRP